MENQKLERQALKLSILSALLMAALGIGFAIVTHSSAILLDGVFSLIFFVVAVFTYYVAKLLNKPANKKFPFGYSAYEPLLNLTKGLLQGTVLVAAITSAVVTALSGGKEIDGEIALYYSIIVTVYCFVFAFYLKYIAKKSQSELIEVDANAWVIDCLLSLAVMLGFITSILIKDGEYHYFLPYIDPFIVIFLGVVSLPMPYTIIKKYWKQVTGKTTENSLAVDIDKTIAPIVDKTKTLDVIRAIQIGRTTYIQIYLIIDKDNHALDSVIKQDEQRDAIYDLLKPKYHYNNIDIIFTHDQKWAERSVNG